MSSPILAVCFDHDGTLVDSEPVHYRMWREVLAPHGVPLTERQYKDHHAGVPTLANAHHLVKQHGLPVSADRLANEKFEAMSRYVARTAFPLLRDVREAIVDLTASGLRLAVVTGAMELSVQTTLREHGLSSLFELVVSAEDVAHNKPAPDGYLQAARRLGLDPAQCVAVEDTEVGVRAAAAAGMPVLAVPHALSRDQDFSRATAVFDCPPAATAWIKARTPLR